MLHKNCEKKLKRFKFSSSIHLSTTTTALLTHWAWAGGGEEQKVPLDHLLFAQEKNKNLHLLTRDHIVAGLLDAVMTVQ